MILLSNPPKQTRDDYAAAARVAADQLVAERFLLRGDVDAAVDAAVAGY